MSLPFKRKFNKFKRVKGTELWCFSCKVNTKNGKKAEAKSYERFIRNLYRLSQVLTICGEVDSKNILHYHGCIRLRTNYYRKNLCVTGYYTHFKRVNNLIGWIDYCHKNDIFYCFEEIKRALFRQL